MGYKVITAICSDGGGEIFIKQFCKNNQDKLIEQFHSLAM